MYSCHFKALTVLDQVPEPSGNSLSYAFLAIQYLILFLRNLHMIGFWKAYIISEKNYHKIIWRTLFARLVHIGKSLQQHVFMTLKHSSITCHTYLFQKPVNQGKHNKIKFRVSTIFARFFINCQDLVINMFLRL